MLPPLKLNAKGYLLPSAIITAFLAVAVFAIVTFINTLAIRRTEETASQAYEVREATQEVLSAMTDAETGQRGFLLTGDPAFLEPHYSGVRKATEYLEKLSDRASEDPQTRAHVIALGDSFQKQQAHLAATIELRGREREIRVSDEVLALVKSGRGKAAMEGARQACQSILAIQEGKLREGEALLRSRTAISRTTITIGNLLALTLIAIVGLAAVVDRRKRDHAELELVKHQHELQAVIESAFEGILTCSDDLAIRYMNPAAAKILGVDLERDAGRNWNLKDFLPAGFRGDELKSSGRQSEQSLAKLPIQRIDGVQLQCEGSVVWTTLEKDHIATIKFRDISETEKLKAREREYASILDKVNEGIVVCDLDDCIQSWNEGAERLFEISKATAIGKSIVELVFNQREGEWRDGRKILLENGSHTATFSKAGSDSQDLVIEQRRSLIFDSNHMPVAQLLLMIDVTARVREEARERRSQRLESIGTLAGGVAHDLNNVLTPIIMSARLLQRGSKSPERLTENIIASADRGARMIQKLLAFAGGEKTDWKQIDVVAILSELEEILRHTLPQSIKLKVTVPVALHRIDGDSTELSQVVMNLAINARDAMPDGGELLIEAEDFVVNASRASRSDILKEGLHILISVSDTGHGIPKGIIDRIFDPFFTTKPQGQGTGLGLATSIGIVRSYGGDISVYSEQGSGSKFMILLPSSKITNKLEAAPMKSPVIPVGNGELILLIDDEALILEAAEETLVSNNYRVLVANGGLEGIATYQRQFAEIDCIILDMMMPNMDGLQVKESLRAIHSSAKIITSSGLRRPSREEGRLLDIEGFLAKPYTDEQLLRLVREVLDKEKTP